jgi:hypothetical protein
MSNAELLLKEIEGLPPESMGEVLDFVGYIKHKALPAERKLHITKLFSDMKPSLTPEEDRDRIQALCAGSKFTVDALLEERRRDLEREKE